MTPLQPVRGTHDLMFDDARRHRWAIDHALQVAHTYGFEEVLTPMFEPTAVFARTLGDASDIVSKEMYTFTDRGGESLTLRPENTAGVVRALISNGLFHKLPLKFFYSGPMFRYERPQKGRQRQFYQIGVESLGLPLPMTDAETILVGFDILKKLALEKSCHLKINTLGDSASRENYRKALVNYLEKFKSDLSPDSQTRLQKNPLRILDSKDKKDQDILLYAPKLSEHMTTESVAFFEKVLQYITELQIPFVHDEKLVRGLDYYTHTVFEFVTTQLGAQDAVMAGGRYDGLVEQMGGPATAGVGWAAGVERLCLLLEATQKLPVERYIMVLPMDDEQITYALKIAQLLRTQSSAPVEILATSQLGKRLKKATQRYNAKYAIIVGSQEATTQTVCLKDLDSGDQKTLPLDRGIFSELKLN